MNTDGNIDGTLSFGTAIDMSGFDEGTQQIEERISEIGSKAESESTRINELLTNVPVVNLDIVGNASESLSKIQEGFDEIDYVVDANKSAIKELEAEYATLSESIKNSVSKGDTKETARLREQAKAVKENIAIRKKVIEEAAKEADSLAKVENALKKESNEAKKTEAPHISLRQRLRELKEELVEMEAAGQRNTQRYREIQDEAGRLTDAWGDATHQASILAHDQRGMQGVISGLSGLSGGFMAASSAVSLFSGENEDLEKVMLKVQQLMSITMGLQQLQATLDKDSAFRLVTLNGLKEWWNKLLAIGAGESAADTAAISANTAAEVANTEATTAEAVAKETAAAAAGGSASAEAIDTAATAANTAAASAGTVANIGLAGAFRMVGAAIKSIPVFGWIAAAIGAIVGVISHFVKKSREAKEAAKEQREMMKDADKAYIEAKVAINDNINALERFNGTKEQEKKLVSDLNSLYGETMGYHSSRSEWLSVLKEKGEAYCNTLLLEAKAHALLNKYTEAYVNLMDIKAAAEAGEYKKWWRSKAGDEKAAQDAVKAAEDNVKKWEDEYNKLQNEISQFKDDNGLDFHPQSTFDPKHAASEIKKALDDYKSSAKQYIKDSENEITQLTIDAQADGLGKELLASRVATERRLEDWRNQLRTLARQRKEILKAQYMSNEGATESGWENSSAGKKTEDDYMNDILAEGGEIAENYYRVRKKITENGESEIAAITQRYNDSLVDEFGTTTQKLEKLEREWFERFASNSIPPEFLDEAIKKMEQEFSSLKSEGFKNLIDWDSVFGDLDNQSIKSLRANLERIKEYFEQNKDSMDATEIKDYTEAIKKMEDEISSRNPFEAMHKSLKDIGIAKTELISAMNEFSEAQKALTEAQNEYNLSEEYYNQLQAEVQNGDLAEDSKEMTDATNRLTEAKTRLDKSTEGEAKAENNVIKVQNKLKGSYTGLVSAIDDCGSAFDGFGGNAKDLAAIFSDDLAESIGEAIDFMDEIIDAASDVINAISDVGVDAAAGVEAAVTASAQGSTAAAEAGAEAMSTIEKASVILAVVSAAMQIATAIGKLIKSRKTKEHEEEIGRITKEYDRLERKIKDLERQAENTFGAGTAAIIEQEMELKKLQIEALEAAIAEEKALKHPDNEKIDEWEEQIADLRNEIADMGEDAEDAIFGESLKSAIENFGDALVEAWESGKSASEAANDYMRKMIKQTVLQAILDYTQASAKIEAIRQKLKEYLENDGIISEDERLNLERMAQKLMDEVGQEFEWAQGLFEGEREGSQRGIATASQESVDENNARLTTIQGHTYSIVQGLDELNLTANEILAKVTGIEANTSETNSKLDNMNSRVRNIESTVDDIQRNGIRLKN